jgi:hypothetical protein
MKLPVTATTGRHNFFSRNQIYNYPPPAKMIPVTGISDTHQEQKSGSSAFLQNSTGTSLMIFPYLLKGFGLSIHHS